MPHGYLVLREARSRGRLPGISSSLPCSGLTWLTSLTYQNRPLPGTWRNQVQITFITAALDAGVPLRDGQEAASHADPRTTMRYDRARTSLDRHATYIVAAFIAGAAR